MTTPSTLPSEDIDATGDDDLDHIFCCNPNLSLCGKDISEDEMTTWDESSEDRTCKLCLILDRQNMGCKGPFCAVRRFFRRRR